MLNMLALLALGARCMDCAAEADHYIKQVDTLQPLVAVPFPSSALLAAVSGTRNRSPRLRSAVRESNLGSVPPFHLPSVLWRIIGSGVDVFFVCQHHVPPLSGMRQHARAYARIMTLHVQSPSSLKLCTSFTALVHFTYKQRVVPDTVQENPQLMLINNQLRDAIAQSEQEVLCRPATCVQRSRCATSTPPTVP